MPHTPLTHIPSKRTPSTPTPSTPTPARPQLAIGGKRAAVHPYDLTKLCAMAQAVKQDRPSFGLVRGTLEGEPVSIFTRRLGGPSHAERREALLVVGPRTRLELHAQDTDLLPFCSATQT